MIEQGKLESAIHHYLVLGLIDDGFAPDIGRLNAIPAGAVRGPDVFFGGRYRNQHAASTVECRWGAQTTRGTKANAPRLFSLLKAQSFIVRPCRAAIDPHGFAAHARTMVGHTGGAPRRSRDLATDCAGCGIRVSRRAGIGFSCHGGNGERCGHHKRQQGRDRKIALYHHRLQFYTSGRPRSLLAP